MTIHFFYPTDMEFFADSCTIPQNEEWIEMNGIVKKIASLDTISSGALAFADDEELWEPCSHGMECWVEVSGLKFLG